MRRFKVLYCRVTTRYLQGDQVWGKIVETGSPYTVSSKTVAMFGSFGLIAMQHLTAWKLRLALVGWSNDIGLAQPGLPGGAFGASLQGPGKEVVEGPASHRTSSLGIMCVSIT